MLLGVVDQAAQILRRDAVDDAGEQLHAIQLADEIVGRAAAAAATKRDLALRVRQLALELAALVDDGRQPLDHFVGSDLEQLGRLAHAIILRGEIEARGIAGQRLDAADAGGDRALAHDLEQADIAGPPDMRAAAELDGISVAGALAVGIDAHRHDAHLIAVFLAEQRQRAFGDGFVRRHQMRLDG